MSNQYSEYISKINNYKPFKRQSNLQRLAVNLFRIAVILILAFLITPVIFLLVFSPLILFGYLYRETNLTSTMLILIPYLLFLFIYIFAVIFKTHVLDKYFSSNDDDESYRPYLEVGNKQYNRIQYLADKFPQVKTKIYQLAQSQNNEILGKDYSLMDIDCFYQDVRYDESITKLKILLDRTE